VSEETGTIVLRSAETGGWRTFQRPREIVIARRPADVLPGLRYLEAAVQERRLHAAGLVSYEAAPGFDPALRVQASEDFPLLWFGLYDGFHEAAGLPPAGRAEQPLDWTPSVSRREYDLALQRIRDRIRAGDTYQVNYSYRLRARFELEPWSWFLHLAARAGAAHAAYLDLGRWAVCCASPELFFRVRDGTLLARPMKGTAARGRTVQEDDQAAARLQGSAKDRAENVMIVDMIRSDVGKVAAPGSVQVPRLCEVERYPTVLQMTSTVTARVSAPLGEVMRALFPCASVTGAPRVRTMEIIAEVESAPRGLYTGSVGHLAPDGERPAGMFNVAIRTAVVDRGSASAEYGVGGAILWDSDAAEEYRESESKARVLRAPAWTPGTELLEALLWTPAEGWFLLDRHLARMSESARYFGIPFDDAAARLALDREAAGLAAGPLGGQPHKVRLVLDSSGAASVSSQPLEAIARSPVQRVRLSSFPVRSSEVLLYHKTSRREVFERARREHPGCDDVILWNERGEITESCTANVVAEVDGARVTPPVSCGLLAGTFRAELLRLGEISERLLTRRELRACPSVWLVNSVRRWMPAALLPD